VDLTYAGKAVDQLVEECDDEKFKVRRIEIRPTLYGFDVRAYDADEKEFKYAMYVEGAREPVIDGS